MSTQSNILYIGAGVVAVAGALYYFLTPSEDQQKIAVGKAQYAKESADKEAQLRQLFNKLDFNNDGTVSFEEMEQQFRRNHDIRVLFAVNTIDAKATDSFIAPLKDAFKEIDSNKDGKLTWEEFKAYFFKARESVHRRVRELEAAVAFERPVRELFNSIDKNGDGVVKKLELVKALNDPKVQQGLRLTVGGQFTTQLEAVFKALETMDKDGNSEVSWIEFLTWAKSV